MSTATDKPVKEPGGAADPVVPFDQPPQDLPGTAAGVGAELAGETQFQGYADIERICEANRIKNDGVQAALPPWTIATQNDERLILRLTHFGVGSVRAMQGKETEDVRMALSWPRNRPLPQYATIEANARTMTGAIVECTSGTAVDIDGAIRANRFRNDGIWYIFPAQMLPGVEVKLRHFGHPYITVVEADTSDMLKARMGIRRNKPLPDYARAEVERVMVLNSILEAKGKVVATKGGQREVVDLGEFDTLQLRAWFRDNLLKPANLTGKVPSKKAEMEEYFKRMYESQNPDVLAAFIEGHLSIRIAENDEILARGESFRVGADWSYDPGSAIYTPQADPVDLTKMSIVELRELFRTSFFPRADLKTRPPKDAAGREAHFVAMYRDFCNGLLNELIELEGEIRELDHDVLLERGRDFVVGASEDTASNG